MHSQLRFGAVVVCLLASGCHRLEKTATDVIGANLKDPGSLQLRNVHRGRISSSTICGEYNAKNTYGGYVGFKPFAIDTIQQNNLSVIDDDTSEETKLDYAINCGAEEQRAQAVITRMMEKEAAKKAAAAGAAPTPPLPDAVPNNSQAPAEAPASTPMSFDKPSVPTPVEQTYCHMGECEWDQIIAVADVTKQGNDLLRKVVTRGTSTETPDGTDYPDSLPAGPHAWTTTTSYYLCSSSRPASIDFDKEAKDWMVTQLTIPSPFGYQQSAVTLYKKVCHGINAGSELDQHPERLGYVDRQDTDQYHVKQLADVWKPH